MTLGLRQRRRYDVGNKPVRRSATRAEDSSFIFLVYMLLNLRFHTCKITSLAVMRDISIMPKSIPLLLGTQVIKTTTRIKIVYPRGVSD